MEAVARMTRVHTELDKFISTMTYHNDIGHFEMRISSIILSFLGTSLSLVSFNMVKDMEHEHYSSRCVRRGSSDVGQVGCHVRGTRSLSLLSAVRPRWSHATLTKAKNAGLCLIQKHLANCSQQCEVVNQRNLQVCGGQPHARSRQARASRRNSRTFLSLW